MTIEVPAEIAGRHEPMNADDGGYVLCARDQEIWPCDAAQLLALIEADEGVEG